MPKSSKKQLNPAIDKKLKVLKYYQNKAIDFSKRNRLLKYPSRALSVEFDIELKECQQFFGSMAELKIELPHKEILKQDIDDQEQKLFNQEEEEEVFPLPKTNVTGKKLITQFDKLRLQAKNNFDSHGLHTLFLAVGEIKWKEELAGRGSSEAVSEYDYSAPLVLIPVQITNQKAPQKRSVIELNDELYDIQVNPVLKLFITQKLELRLPASPDDFSDFSWEEVVKLLRRFEKVFEERKIDCITTTKMRLGQFTFHGQQIYEDLTRNETEIIGHEFVSSLCGDSQIIQSTEAIQVDDEDNVDDFLTEEEDYTILDADESQLRSIKSVLDGKHLVVHGPPGTGKSQTIANLIANLLARDKKVLFVCEKKVALDVVYNRLKTKGAHVSDLCLPLFQYTTDKKLFAKSIIESRNRVIGALRKVSKDSINEKLAERKQKIDSLKKYADSLLSVREPINKTVYWMHGELSRVLPKVEGIVFPWRDKNPDEIDFATYQRLNHILNDLSGYSDLIFDKENHWKNLKQTSFSPDYSARLFGKLEELRQTVEDFPKLNGTVFGNPKNINGVNNILNFANNNDIKELLKNRHIISDVFDSDSLENEINFSEKIKHTLNKYDEVAGTENKYKIPVNWEQTVFEYSLLDKNFEIAQLISGKVEVSFIENKLKTFEKTVLNNKYSKELLGLTGETIKKYKNLFDTDPIVQKIKGWDERLSLYEVQTILKNIENIYDELVNSQEILNEWAISINDIDPKIIWEIEQRFSTQYKSFFRFLYLKYKDDKKSITNWCSAHRPQNYSDYRKIIFAAADKLRLQVKFEKMMTDFVEKYATDESVKNVSIVSLTTSVSKILNYLETANIDRLSTEIKTLVSATDCFDGFKQVIAFYEELLNQKQLLNTATNQNLLTDNISLEDFLKYTKGIIKEYNLTVSVFEKTNEFLEKKSSNLETLNSDIEILNKLNKLCDELISYSHKKYLGIENIADLIGEQDKIENQQKQIRVVLQILNGNTFSKKDFYQNIEILYSEIAIWGKWYMKYQDVKNGLELLMNNNEALGDFEVIDMSVFSKHINKMIVDNDGLEKWTKLQRVKSQLDEYGMAWFFVDICERGIKQINFSDIFTWSLINKLLADIYENDEVLKNFNMPDYVRYIKEFRKLENEVFETNQYRVLSKVYPNIKFAMDRGGNSEKVLVRESQKIKRHVPIRKLVTENASHLLNYKPCWMMSPLTLSSYIPFGAIKFDVVIFDEASQMKIENALGSISRANQVIVIGDEHQLPPTSFFDVLSDDDDEEEMEEVGYESILQSAITILPGAQSELLYHYRSTSDDLIAFSNNYIYDNKLITFPAPKYKNDAVQFEYVENGIYDGGMGKTRQNRIEAIRVAELCIEHFKLNTTSLGVIAFSKAQEEAIREAIAEKINKEYSYLADKFDESTNTKDKNNEEASFFIRNLESSQGDQRDVIIISVGYGPDQNGNVFNRFGPINSKGGYRRLNVAITRAKDKVICVSSMKFYQMSPPETSRGAILLQKYLEYAEKGREVLEASKILRKDTAEADSDFEISVQNALENLGYVIHRQVGASGFSIDLAVVNPENQNEYILGIECDGAAYHSSKSARIRDRLRQQILERLGWNFYRVWSQHWIAHRQEVIDDIVEVINKKQ